MKRSMLSFALAAAVAAAVSSTAVAAPLPSGTIACEIDAKGLFTSGMRISPFVNDTPSRGAVTLKDTVTGTCDASGVTGGKAPITNFQARLVAKLGPGTVCSDLVTAPHFERIKLTLKWTNVELGRKRVVATSKVHNYVGSYDDASEALVFTGQILKGAFAGTPVTMRVTLDDAGFYADGCPSVEGIQYGSDGESTLTVP